MHVNGGAGGKGISPYEANAKATKRGVRPGNATLASSRYVCWWRFHISSEHRHLSRTPPPRPRAACYPFTLARVPANLPRVPIGILLIHTASRLTRVEECGCRRACTHGQASLIRRQIPRDAEYREYNRLCKTERFCGQQYEAERSELRNAPEMIERGQIKYALQCLRLCFHFSPL